MAGSGIVSGLRVAVDQYLIVRRRLGFKLERAGRLLPHFVTYLERAGATTVTSDLALAWARGNGGRIFQLASGAIRNRARFRESPARQRLAPRGASSQSDAAADSPGDALSELRGRDRGVDDWSEIAVTDAARGGPKKPSSAYSRQRACV